MQWPPSCLDFTVATSLPGLSVVSGFLPGFCGAGDASPYTFPGLCLPTQILYIINPPPEANPLKEIPLPGFQCGGYFHTWFLWGWWCILLQFPGH